MVPKRIGAYKVATFNLPLRNKELSFVPHQRCQQATERRARGNWYHGMFASNLSVIVIDTG